MRKKKNWLTSVVLKTDKIKNKDQFLIRTKYRKILWMLSYIMQVHVCVYTFLPVCTGVWNVDKCIISEIIAGFYWSNEYWKEKKNIVRLHYNVGRRYINVEQKENKDEGNVFRIKWGRVGMLCSWRKKKKILNMKQKYPK